MNVKLAKVCFPLLAISLLGAAAGAKDTDCIEPVATVRDVMLGLTVPASDFLWAIYDAPTDDSGWQSARLNAVMLAESGNLLLVEGRSREGDIWFDQARALVQAATAASKAANSMDLDGIIESGDAIYNTCETCHAAYLPK